MIRCVGRVIAELLFSLGLEQVEQVVVDTIELQQQSQEQDQ